MIHVVSVMTRLAATRDTGGAGGAGGGPSDRSGLRERGGESVPDESPSSDSSEDSSSSSEERGES